MKTKNRRRFTKWKVIATIILICFASQKILAATNYVGTTGTPGGNYFTDIQSAVNASSGGDFVIVSNGTYVLSSQIEVNTNLTIQSVTGPENTIIDGNNTNRCFYLYEHNIVISGFTITNGNTGSGYYHDGGGIYCADGEPVITNCTIIGNFAGDEGGGVRGCTIINCIVSGNSAEEGGGISEGTVNNCLIIRNSASGDGGGINFGTVNNCLIIGNSTENSGGGVIWAEINNCTISGNSAGVSGGGNLSASASINNSIIYYNSAPENPNREGGTYRRSCTTPAVSGEGNISSLPQFVGTNSSNYRIKSTSPCINAGDNSYAPMPVDLDGNPRIDVGIVDMGCYEYPFPFINITNEPAVVSHYQQTAGISGTNLNIAGNLYWVNSRHNISTNLFLPGFSTTITNLEPGENLIQVFGMNILAFLTNDFVNIHRETWEEIHPFIKITNAPAVVPYHQQTAEVNGTNLNIEGLMYWVNSRNEAATNIVIQGFSTTINNLEHGDNNITILGENKYGDPTNDAVNIHRKTLIESEPKIATNALIFPAVNSMIYASQWTNISWDAEKITDDIDGTNLTITKIDLHYADTTNFIVEVTNNIANTLGKIEWYIPSGSWDGKTNYVLKFEVVNSLSLTNSRIFWDNKFIVVPEPGVLLLEFTALACLFLVQRRLTK